MRIHKPIIKVKDGQAYLHIEYIINKIIWEDIMPLGNSLKIIKEIVQHYKCKVKFL